ncbi:MAG: hypothetical protein ACREJ3_00560, partial [Polyangiaceae bacterium]
MCAPHLGACRACGWGCGAAYGVQERGASTRRSASAPRARKLAQRDPAGGRGGILGGILGGIRGGILGGIL